jgi:hypothetical protein
MMVKTVDLEAIQIQIRVAEWATLVSLQPIALLHLKGYLGSYHWENVAYEIEAPPLEDPVEDPPANHGANRLRIH